MKKYLFSSIVGALFVIYLVVARSTAAPSAVQQDSTYVPSAGDSSSAGSAGTSQATSVPGSTVSTSKGQFTDGTYVGSSEDAFWGTVQVQAVVSGGKISNVTFLSYPNDRHESVQINTRSMPQLVSEAIKAQSATVDIVSGATDTSEAFMKSLGAALGKAKA